MSTRLIPYSTFTTRMAALTGISESDLPTSTATAWNSFFNSAMLDIWTRANWLDICPRGEARFLGNRLSYPNNTSVTASWTATALTITANSVQNPADGATNASKMMETAANSAHKIVQTVTTFYPSQDYKCSFYIRPNGRNDVQLSVSDGVTTHSAFFDMSDGTVGTVVNTTATSMTQQPNGFWLCTLSFTADSAATTSGSYSVLLSTDGSTTSYAGDTTKGIYIWGCLTQQMSDVPINDYLLSYEQTGEEVIEAVFECYASSPMTAAYPTRLGYELTDGGIQVLNSAPSPYAYYVNGVIQSSIFGSPPSNPIFIYYRKRCPDFTGDDYSASATYTVGQQIFFEASDGTKDYWRCVVATSAGESPTTTAASWSKRPIYEPLFQYLVRQSYADWILSDGQFEKAMGAVQLAQKSLDDFIEIQERQMAFVLPMKVATHVTSRAAT